ncbi:hypothetical protein QBC45DRAFT_427285 [Copromyces sp. CBS 386.78]|nr:hypothetical protein QBC45DRAFT_427285 [Copromyces sp. CBS 386.78]
MHPNPARRRQAHSSTCIGSKDSFFLLLLLCSAGNALALLLLKEAQLYTNVRSWRCLAWNLPAPWPKTVPSFIFVFAHLECPRHFG